MIFKHRAFVVVAIIFICFIMRYEVYTCILYMFGIRKHVLGGGAQPDITQQYSTQFSEAYVYLVLCAQLCWIVRNAQCFHITTPWQNNSGDNVPWIYPTPVAPTHGKGTIRFKLDSYIGTFVPMMVWDDIGVGWCYWADLRDF